MGFSIRVPMLGGVLTAVASGSAVPMHAQTSFEQYYAEAVALYQSWYHSYGSEPHDLDGAALYDSYGSDYYHSYGSDGHDAYRTDYPRDSMRSWYRAQAANDRAHQKFIDYIWGTDSQDRSWYHSYGAPYGQSYGSGYAYDQRYGRDYLDPMSSWYRNQAANDRAHAAFIDYIRNE